MSGQKELEIFQEILARTKEGRLAWEVVSSEDTFVVAIKGKYTLVLKSYRDEDNWGNQRGGPNLIMKDSDDHEILEINESIKLVNPEELKELYQTVRYQALHIGEKVDDLLGDLKSL